MKPADIIILLIFLVGMIFATHKVSCHLKEDSLSIS